MDKLRPALGNLGQNVRELTRHPSDLGQRLLGHPTGVHAPRSDRNQIGRTCTSEDLLHELPAPGRSGNAVGQCHFHGREMTGGSSKVGADWAA